MFSSQKLTAARNGASHMQIGYSVVLYSKLLECCLVQQVVTVLSYTASCYSVVLYSKLLQCCLVQQVVSVVLYSKLFITFRSDRGFNSYVFNTYNKTVNKLFSFTSVL